MGSSHSKKKDDDEEQGGSRRNSRRNRRDTFVFGDKGDVKRRSTIDPSLTFDLKPLTYIQKLRRHLLHRRVCVYSTYDNL